MPTTLIEQRVEKMQQPLYGVIKEINPQGGPYSSLDISEMFSDTLQGEGINSGVPATFIRMQGCTLKCSWCDTLDVWPHGSKYYHEEVFALMESVGLIQKLDWGQHLILTGGSPLKQQDSLVSFIRAFQNKYGFKPYIEVENEAVLMPIQELEELVDCWNNSPKLANSGMRERVRYRPEVLSHMSALDNSWFKFVVTNDTDWKEIQEMYLDTHLIKKSQIILMPEGQTQEELQKSREYVAEICCREGIRYCDRMHVIIWNKKTGV